MTDLYIYDNGVLNVIKIMKSSGRGEFEIMDVNNEYILQAAGGIPYWMDTGANRDVRELVEGWSYD